jgi:pimeloyl-ACP methyl ester carboxylesterase
MTYVLIPGAGGAAWYWHRVESALRKRGHDVVAVDLPADDDAAGLPEYADAILAAIGGRQHDVVLVAQSMGAFSAPLVCAQRPVALLVLVNPMIPAPGETAGDWWANTGQAAAMRANDAREGRSAAAGPGDPAFDQDVYFLHDVPEHVAAAGAAHRRRQAGTPFGQPWPLAAWPAVPTRMLTGRDDRLFPAQFQRRLAEQRLGITPDEIDGGHLVALVHPARVADYLEACRAQIAVA